MLQHLGSCMNFLQRLLRDTNDKSIASNVLAQLIFQDHCSVLFFSRPGSEGWPHHGRTFSIYPCPLSF